MSTASQKVRFYSRLLKIGIILIFNCRLLVQKEGPNKGRYFYGCPKGPSSTCKFFQWADDPPSNDSGFDSNFSGNFSSERGARTQGKGQATKKPRTTGGKRKCGICGVEGELQCVFYGHIQYLMFSYYVIFRPYTKNLSSKFYGLIIPITRVNLINV